MQDGGAARVQELKTLQDLKAPTLQQLQLHLTEPAQVPEEHTGPCTPGINIQPEGSIQVVQGRSPLRCSEDTELIPTPPDSINKGRDFKSR